MFIYSLRRGNANVMLEVNGTYLQTIFRLPLSQTLKPILVSYHIYYHDPKEVDVQNLVGIDSAITVPRMREKARYRVESGN